MDGGGDRLAEHRAVVLRDKPRISDDDDSTVALRAYEPSKPLAEANDGLRESVVSEGTTALALDPLATRLDYRVAHLRERKTRDDDARKRLSRDVDALPERLCTEEDYIGIRLERLRESPSPCTSRRMPDSASGMAALSATAFIIS